MLSVKMLVAVLTKGVSQNKEVLAHLLFGR